MSFIDIAEDLEVAGLPWLPEIGDEISYRTEPERVSILVDPNGMTPRQLREVYIWLPSVEQLIFQFEARQAILHHTGVELTEKGVCYKTIIKQQTKRIETIAFSLRNSLGLALRDLLISDGTAEVH